MAKNYKNPTLMTVIRTAAHSCLSASFFSHIFKYFALTDFSSSELQHFKLSSQIIFHTLYYLSAIFQASFAS